MPSILAALMSGGVGGFRVDANEGSARDAFAGLGNLPIDGIAIRVARQLVLNVSLSSTRPNHVH